MPFIKGQSGNPKGRPTGAISERTKQWNALGDILTGEGADRIVQYLDELWAADKDKFFAAYKSLLNYFKPKMSSGTIDLEAEVKMHSPPSWFGHPIDTDTMPKIPE